MRGKRRQAGQLDNHAGVMVELGKVARWQGSKAARRQGGKAARQLALVLKTDQWSVPLVCLLPLIYRASGFRATRLSPHRRLIPHFFQILTFATIVIRPERWSIIFGF